MASSSSSSPEPPVSPPASDRYFCHRCVREVDNINQDSFTCPFCNQGFLEQIPARADSHDEHDAADDGAHSGAAATNPAAADFNEFLRRVAFPMLFPGTGQQRQGAFAGAQASTNHPGSSAAGTGQGQPQVGPNAPLQTFLQNLLEGLAGGGGAFQVQVQIDGQEGQPQFFGFPMPPLHGNPGDYAWGPGGLDEIVTRLLNQFEGGSPPLTEEQIRNLPEVEVTHEQVDKRLQCTVCMDDFKLQEKVRRLPCGHHFHEACIVPWLSRHNTCPVCRKTAASTGETTTGSAPGGSSGQSGAGAGSSNQQAWNTIEELD